MSNNTINIEAGNTSEFLTQFINAYNQDLADAERNQDKIELLEAKLTQSYLECDREKEVNKSLALDLTATHIENKKYQDSLLVAEKSAHTQVGTKRELALSKARIKDLQKELTSLKGGDSPKRLREQIKRIKEKSISDKKRMAAQERALKEARSVLVNLEKSVMEKESTICNLNKQLAHNTGSGLYHNGEHHLIIWPEKTVMEREDGERFEGRSLLYMHQSGRGGLITFDPIDGQAYLCKAPKNGLRPSEACKEFAKDWLYSVNELQNGVVKEKDMLAVNYNPDPKD